MCCFKLKLEKGFRMWVLGQCLMTETREFLPFSVGIGLVNTLDTLTWVCRFRNYRRTLCLGPLLVDQAWSVLTSQPTVLTLSSLHHADFTWKLRYDM